MGELVSGITGERILDVETSYDDKSIPRGFVRIRLLRHDRRIHVLVMSRREYVLLDPKRDV